MEFSFSRLIVPFVYGLIFFLGYPSQWLLMQLEPAPLTRNELIVSNVVLVLIFITYTKTVFVDPGRIPADWAGSVEKNKQQQSDDKAKGKSRKWCRKCNAAKPPRAHHCKQCKRCIPKMDHHCPWTANCVSHTTFPHFLRFLLYTTSGLSLLQYLLWHRLAHLWATRHQPSYLGPNTLQLSHLFTTTLVNTITLFALLILLLRHTYALALNTTTIESWEIERHVTLVRRARHFGGYLDTPDGHQIRIAHQEFPYDIGIASNIRQGMGGSPNPLAWFNPFARTPRITNDTLMYATNGFEDAETTWPPPDPDRAYRRRDREVDGGGDADADAFTYHGEGADAISAFRARQAADEVRRRRPFVKRLEERKQKQQQGGNVHVHGWTTGNPRGGDVDVDEVGYGYGYGGDDDTEEVAMQEEEDDKYGDGGEEAWRNAEGERLQDFGVDEDVEFYDEQEEDDEIPLSELLARRRAASASGQQVYS